MTAKLIRKKLIHTRERDSVLSSIDFEDEIQNVRLWHEHKHASMLAIGQLHHRSAKIQNSKFKIQTCRFSWDAHWFFKDVEPVRGIRILQLACVHSVIA